MYMLSYKTRTFKTHNSVDECKQEASLHAMENPRLKGEYIITKVKELGNTGLVSTDLAVKPHKGVKHGKTIEWIN